MWERNKIYLVYFALILFPITGSRTEKRQEAVVIVGQEMRMIWTREVTVKMKKGGWIKDTCFYGRAAMIGWWTG